MKVYVQANFVTEQQVLEITKISVNRMGGIGDVYAVYIDDTDSRKALEMHARRALAQLTGLAVLDYRRPGRGHAVYIDGDASSRKALEMHARRALTQLTRCAALC